MRLGATLTLALLGVFVQVAGAGAGETRVQTFPGYHQTSFDVRGSDGYRVQFSVGHGSAQLLVSRHGSGFNTAASFYSTRSRFTGTRVDADFGRFGQVTGRFEQRGPTQEPPDVSGCEGGGPVRRIGRFVGTIAFHGEGRYTEAHASTAKAEVVDVPPLRCHGFGDQPHQGEVVGQGTSLSISCANPSFEASTEGLKEEVFPEEPLPETTFSASMSERVGRVRVIRFASAGGPASTFVFDQTLSSATVSPPPPFHGSATFTRGAGGATGWSGDLAVDFPGTSASLVRPNADVDLSHYPIRAQQGAAIFITAERCPGKR